MSGIAIMGLNGSGKSTLTHALSKVINYYEMDVEDYYFPEQKSSRRAALEDNYDVQCEYLGNMPYAVSRTKTEVQELLYKDILAHSEFILCGVTMNWSEEIISHIGIAFILHVPTEKRVNRIQNREQKRFGNRVANGGDMYEQQKAFKKIIAQKDEKDVTDSAKKIQCKVIFLDGTKPVEENIKIILQEIESICGDKR